MRKPEMSAVDLIAEALYQPERPVLLGDTGDDALFATESHPEGLRYGERPHAPGSVEHGALRVQARRPNGDISIG